MDKLTPENRSKNMAAIKAKNTKPEMRVRKFLHRKGLRYSLHKKEMPGKPDLVFTSRKTVLFVNGCFWHGHKNCKDAGIPKTRAEWWSDKIGKTIDRDKRNSAMLIAAGWQVMVIWECEINDANLLLLEKAIRSANKIYTI